MLRQERRIAETKDEAIYSIVDGVNMSLLPQVPWSNTRSSGRVQRFDQKRQEARSTKEALSIEEANQWKEAIE